ncbi:MAG: zinc ribbon domain-containing protein [Clostridia bacterium]|nr:zinc ribbon domain-containing protein [Clostridia bacterium]
MKNIKEEIHYCTTCGAVNKKSAVFCEECKNKIIVRHRPIADFLKKRVKGKAAGKATEKLFELVKDFLFEHLYGLILTVSVVGTVTTVVVTATPYIENVKASPSERNTEAVIEEVVTETGVDPEYASWCEKYTDYLMSHYSDQAEAVVWAHEGYTVDENNLSLDEIYAERAIPNFPYQGAHEMMTERIPLGIYHNGTPDSPRGITEVHDTVEGSLKFGADVASPLGQTLYAGGWEVMESNFEIALYEGLDRDGTRESFPVEKEEYRILMVRNEDDWYIAEDVLVDRIKGETYDLYMQYGYDGIVTVEY